jgi:hypothetical protein
MVDHVKENHQPLSSRRLHSHENQNSGYQPHNCITSRPDWSLLVVGYRYLKGNQPQIHDFELTKILDLIEFPFEI